ncbi:MAG: hypothetical protein ABI670_15630 [Chloroflexota bacterium]
MDDIAADPPITGPRPADKAATSALIAACASLVFAGLGAGLAVNLGFGILPLLLGMLGWIIAWTVGMGLAIGALRNAYSSANAVMLKRKAWGAIGVCAFSLVLVITYIFALVIAAQRLVESQ